MKNETYINRSVYGTTYYGGKSKYKYVYINYNKATGVAKYYGKVRIKSVNLTTKIFSNERLAAIEVDKILISYNKEPVNILKSK